MKGEEGSVRPRIVATRVATRHHRNYRATIGVAVPAASMPMPIT